MYFQLLSCNYLNPRVFTFFLILLPQLGEGGKWASGWSGLSCQVGLNHKTFILLILWKIIYFSLSKEKDKDKMFSAALDGNNYDQKGKWRAISSFWSRILALTEFYVTHLSLEKSNFCRNKLRDYFLLRGVTFLWEMLCIWNVMWSVIWVGILKQKNRNCLKMMWTLSSKK